MTCKYCPILPEFTCSNCEQPLCYPCAIKAYICDHTQNEDIALSCSQCNKIFKTKDKWLLTILKLQYWDTENPIRPNIVSWTQGMSSQVYCNCNRPNTRQTAFARANGFDCPDCNRKLNPNPNAESYQNDDNAQDSPSSPTPNFLPPSPLSQHSGFPIPPDNYPHTLAELRDVPIFKR